MFIGEIMNGMKTIPLRPLLTVVLIFMYSALFSQDINQGINTITVKGVTFKQVADRLVSSGYVIGRMDSKSKTIQTAYSKYTKTGSANLSIRVKMRDSVAVITGRMCYNINNIDYGIPDSTNTKQISYTYGYFKAGFLQLDKFAKSFNKPVIIYSNN